MTTTAHQRIKRQSAAQLPLVQKQKRRQQKQAGYALPGAEKPWREWLAARFPALTQFAPRHIRLWTWFDALKTGEKPRPRVEVWPRGGAKSSTGELGCVRLGWKLSRRFVLYVSETQPQADKHVQSIASFFERLNVGRALGKYGSSKGWRRDQLRTENGFNVAGIGLDVAARGVKLDEFRPDLIIFDDIDGRHDSPEKTAKKIATITASLLPAGSADCAILFLQNLIAKDGIVSQLADGRAEFLHTREVPCVEPAVVGLTFRQQAQPDGTLCYRIIGGVPTWEGQDLAVCETQINDWGLAAFLREAQQEVEEQSGGLWDRARDLDPFYEAAPPVLERIVIAVDPSGSSRGDEVGIVAAGIFRIGKVQHGWVLDDLSLQGSPHTWIAESVRAFKTLKADKLLAEVNFGGEIVAAAFETEAGAPPVTMIRVSRGKLVRAEPVHALYEKGVVHHVKRLPNLEKQLCTWKPGMPSPGALDALVIALSYLFGLNEMVQETKPVPAVRPTAFGLNRR